MMRIAAMLSALAMLAPTALDTSSTAQGVGYICGAEHQDAITGPSRLVILDGMGSGGFPIRTADPRAQAWFDYGLKLYHAFYHNEAKAAFARAESYDPACAMCAWGEALALGPTLNYGISPSETAAALVVANHAADLAKNAGDRDKALIKALQDRYRPVAPGAKTEPAYGLAMAEITRRFPADDEVANLAAHALITPARADDFSGVPGAMALLKGVLARHPDDTAAIHYYIHATEFAHQPALALPYAERLASLAPGASHLVHMGAHTMIHVGRYEEVAVLDAEALKVDADKDKALGDAGPLGQNRYYQHNLLFGLTGAVMAGDRTLALKVADDAPVAFPAGKVVDPHQTALARSLIVYGRFDPDRALAIPAPPADQAYLAILRHNARGEAFAQKSDAAGVLAEASALAALKLPPDQADNATLSDISQHVLRGRAAMLQGHYDEAAKLFTDGADLQLKAYGDRFDPPPWWYPIRRSVAAADLMAGRYADAAREARASLAAWPDDGLALLVLSQAEAKQGQGAAADHLARAKHAWRGDLGRVKVATI